MVEEEEYSVAVEVDARVSSVDASTTPPLFDACSTPGIRRWDWTSLESMKTRRNEDTALAVLEAYARSLTRTAAQLRERARDVVYAHYSAIGRACPLDGPGPRTPDLMGRVMRTARLVTEWAYDLGRAARLETEALVGIRAADVSNLACCGGTPPPSLAREKERAGGGAI